MSRGAGSGGSGNQSANRYVGGKKPYGALLTSSGEHIVATPSEPTRRIECGWVYFVPSSDNDNANLITVRFEDAVENLYCGYASSHWEPFVGLPGKSLLVITSTAEAVAVTIHYRELI